MRFASALPFRCNRFSPPRGNQREMHAETNDDSPIPVGYCERGDLLDQQRAIP